LLGDQFRSTAITKLEILYSARTAAQYDEWDEALSGLRELPITQSICNAAVTAMGRLAAHSDGRHRVPLPDYLLAACAEEHAIGVLHYDRHFDRLREVFIRKPVDCASQDAPVGRCMAASVATVPRPLRR